MRILKERKLHFKRLEKHISAQRMVCIQLIRQLNLKMFEFFKEEKDECCSVTPLIKYKPFYITNTTEREKESYICKRS